MLPRMHAGLQVCQEPQRGPGKTFSWSGWSPQTFLPGPSGKKFCFRIFLFKMVVSGVLYISERQWGPKCCGAWGSLPPTPPSRWDWLYVCYFCHFSENFILKTSKHGCQKYLLSSVSKISSYSINRQALQSVTSSCTSASCSTSKRSSASTSRW